MTIAVSIENQDKSRSIVVVEKSYNKVSGGYEYRNDARLKPGERRTFYCYLLRDLIIREVDDA